MAVARDFKPGAVVNIEAVVVRQDNHQTLMWVPGIGKTGCWSIVNSAEVTLSHFTASSAELARLKGLEVSEQNGHAP